MANQVETNCRGFGSQHTAPGGRLFMSCARCRWSASSPPPVSLDQLIAALDRQIAALDRQIAREDAYLASLAAQA